MAFSVNVPSTTDNILGNMNSNNIRFSSIDVLRGIAIFMMVSYHFAFNFVFIGLYHCNFRENIYWVSFRLLIVSIFTIVMGASLSIRIYRGLNSTWLIRRLLVLGGSAALVTLVTYLIFPKGVIKFGAIHFYFIATIICSFLAPNKKLILFSGIIIIAIGFLYSNDIFNDSLFWLGFVSKKPRSLDYLPVFPWIGFVLTGMYLGSTIFWKRTCDIVSKEFISNKFVSFFKSCGKHSLLIYLFHQPLLYLLAILISYFLPTTFPR